MSFVDPRTVLDEAQEFAKQGRNEEALQRHIWFHQHALEHDPALCGVRVSFALGAWARLGEQYPPARQALLDVRAQTAGAMRAGNWPPELVRDVMALNRAVGEVDENATLFLDLHRMNPAGAGQFYRTAEPALFARGLYAVCAAHLTDAMSRFAEAREFRRDVLSMADEIPSDDGIYREVMEQGFARDVVQLITILAAVGRGDEVEQVRSAALAETQSTEARESISRAGF